MKAQRCPECSAPLPVGPNDTVVTCRYCGNSISIERRRPPKTAAAFRAPDAPPTTPPHTIYVGPSSATIARRVLLFSILLPAAIPILVAGIPHLLSRSGGSAPASTARAPFVGANAAEPDTPDTVSAADDAPKPTDLSKLAEPSSQPKRTGATTTPAARSVPVKTASAEPPRPPVTPPFDSDAAARLLDQAKKTAEGSCPSTAGKKTRVWITPGFNASDGLNANAKVTSVGGATPQDVACVETVFKRVRIAPFDEKSRPSGLMRPVDLTPRS